MKIDIAKLGPEGSEFTGEEPADILQIEKEPGVSVESPVHYALHAQVITGELLVQGRVWADFRVACRRCAEFFSTTVADSAFLRAFPVTSGTETVDCTEDIRESVLLLLPPYPLCRPDCRGLCPICGGNRNVKPCDCKPREDGGNWRALDDLKL